MTLKQYGLVFVCSHHQMKWHCQDSIKKKRRKSLGRLGQPGCTAQGVHPMRQCCLQLQICSPFIPKTVRIKPHFSMIFEQLTAARQTGREGLRRTCWSGSCISAIRLRAKVELVAGWGSTSCAERARASKTHCCRLEPGGTRSISARKNTRHAQNGGAGRYDEVRNCC